MLIQYQDQVGESHRNSRTEHWGTLCPHTDSWETRTGLIQTAGTQVSVSRPRKSMGPPGIVQYFSPA